MISTDERFAISKVVSHFCPRVFSRPVHTAKSERQDSSFNRSLTSFLAQFPSTMQFSIVLVLAISAVAYAAPMASPGMMNQFPFACGQILT